MADEQFKRQLLYDEKGTKELIKLLGEDRYKRIVQEIEKDIRENERRPYKHDESKRHVMQPNIEYGSIKPGGSSTPHTCGENPYALCDACAAVFPFKYVRFWKYSRPVQ